MVEEGVSESPAPGEVMYHHLGPHGGGQLYRA